MLSDDSSSDSETGRFKGRSKEQEDQGSKKKEGNLRDVGRGRHSDNDRFRRDLDRRRDDRVRIDRYPKDRQDRHRYSRHSPMRRRHSRERSPNKRPREHRDTHQDSRGRSKPRDHSRERQKPTRSGSHKSLEEKKDIKVEIKRNVPPREKSPKKPDRKSREISFSPELKGKRSVIHKPQPIENEQTKRSESPIVVEEQANSDASVEVQPGSYYNMIPTVVKEKTDESSEIDSSDDEKLRAKLLNLEKELCKTKKKKHKKKHKRKSTKSKEKESDTSALVEVTSTTDIQDKVNIDLTTSQSESAEVSSTQKNNQKESSEEGELSSDDDCQIDIDPSDLRHKLRGSKRDSTQDAMKSNMDVCGPALPPHLEKQVDGSTSPDIEGPALPPHLQRKTNIGPAIPDDLRKVLADRLVVCESSDEDTGIGPLPAGAEDKWSEAHQRLEERALDIKIKQLDGQSLQDGKVKSREEWMLELPEGKAKYLGLEARSFRAKAGPDMSDRSSWTDTPEDKARKAAGQAKEEDAETALKREARARLINNKDDEQETAVKKHKKKHKRDESLLEMHEKKLKKKKKKDEKEEGKKERRPFSRDVDLQANRFDEAQKKSIIKKSQELNTRFSRGEAKYL